MGQQVWHEFITLLTRDDELHFKTVQTVAHGIAGRGKAEGRGVVDEAAAAGKQSFIVTCS
jgi:hypothetical protein